MPINDAHPCGFSFIISGFDTIKYLFIEIDILIDKSTAFGPSVATTANC